MSAGVAEFTTKEVAQHRRSNDAWMIIHGQVYDVTKYLEDHPGGAEILLDSAGEDASEAFDNAGHSEEAFEIMTQYRIGKAQGAEKPPAPKAVRAAAKAKPQVSKRLIAIPKAAASVVVSIGALAGSLLGLQRIDLAAVARSLNAKHLGGPKAGFGFVEGFMMASAICLAVGGYALHKFSQLLTLESGVRRYPPRIQVPKVSRPNLLLQHGFLDPQTFQGLPLVKKELAAPNTYRLVFELPTLNTILGLPIGQHVAIKATIDGQAVQRSYTPVSNNADKGVLELIVKNYADGLLTGRYLAHLRVGDEVQFRGPKGAMRYRQGLCKKIGMLAGGTGITPMYQLVRAICEDERDTTEISLIYANRTEEDILLRPQLETFARRYPKNFKLHYLLDVAPQDWTYGTGYVTKELMQERFPAAAEEGSKVMICGPPGMVNAAKKALIELGYEKPGAASKLTDQVFCF